MQSGTALESGEVVLVPFPFTNLSQTKRRPVVVLSNRNYNDATNDFICCAITSNLRNRRNSLLLDPSELVMGSIPKRSRIKYGKVYTLEKSLIVKALGRIGPEKLAQVKEGLLSILG